MTAQQNGKRSWTLDDGPQKTAGKADKADATEALNVIADNVATMTLKQLQELVQILVQLKDTDRLLALLGCTREIFRQADQAMGQGKSMGIKDDVDGWS